MFLRVQTYLLTFPILIRPFELSINFMSYHQHIISWSYLFSCILSKTSLIYLLLSFYRITIVFTWVHDGLDHIASISLSTHKYHCSCSDYLTCDKYSNILECKLTTYTPYVCCWGITKNIFKSVHKNSLVYWLNGPSYYPFCFVHINN